MLVQKQDSGKTTFAYAWVIVFVLFAGHIISFGMRASFGAFIAPWELDFSVGRTVVSSISFLGFVCFALGQPIAGRLNDRFGKGIVPTVCVFLMGASLFLMSHATQIWQIFILYVLGFSCGIAGSTSSVVAAIITKWFDKKKGFAIGLGMSGMAAGQLIVVPANLFIIERYGWRTAMMILGLIGFVIIGPLFLFFLRSRPEEKGMKPYGYEEPPNGGNNSGSIKPATENPAFFSLLKVKPFWFLLIPYFICGFTDVGLINTHLIPIANWKSISIAGVAIAISLAAILNITGTITTGYLSDHFNRKRQLAVIYAIRSTTLILLVFLGQPWLLMIFAMVFGAVEMASIAPTNSLAAQLFDGHSTGVVLGLVALSHQFGGALGSWVPGLIFDLTHSYTPTLVLSILLLFGSAFLVLLFPEFDRKKQ